ncbi:MAG TPA: hypothetical protein VGB58_05405 [Blastococcus sp.]
MRIRRPIATLMTALALFGGGVTMTACESAGQGQNDGTTDDSENTGGSEQESEVPDNSNQEPNDEDDGDDQTDPD